MKNDLVITRSLAIVCGLLLLFSCNKEEIDHRVPYEVIYESTLSYAEEIKIPKQIIVENENEWKNFISQIETLHQSQAEILKNLSFDFAKNDLVIVIGEFYNYCCSQIIINSVSRKNGEISVDFEETGPGIATALSQAYLLLKIPV